MKNFRIVIGTLLLVCAQFVICTGTIAQPSASTRSSPRPQGSVEYEQTISGMLPTKASLVFTSQEALYFFARKDTAETSRKMQEVAENKFVVDIRDQEGYCIFTDKIHRKLLTRTYEFSEKSFLLIQDTLPEFKWVIGTATKTIGPYRVQQAATTFRGRRYEAWFAPELPVSFGPWKFSGLPGLVLEAYDSDKLFRFEALTVSIPSKTLTPVIPPVTGKPIPNWATYGSRVKESRSRYIRFLNSHSPGVTAKITTDSSQELLP